MLFPTIVAVAAVFAPVQAQSAVEPLVGRWEGTLSLPDDVFLPVVLRVSKGADGTVTALADDPMNGTTDTPVQNLTLQDGKVHFEVTGVEGHADATLTGETITGSWISSQGPIPLSLTRIPAS